MLKVARVPCVQMHLEGSRIVKANNETAFNYFKRSADKVGTDDQLIVSHFCVLSCFRADEKC